MCPENRGTRVIRLLRPGLFMVLAALVGLLAWASPAFGADGGDGGGGGGSSGSDGAQGDVAREGEGSCCPDMEAGGLRGQGHGHGPGHGRGVGRGQGVGAGSGRGGGPGNRAANRAANRGRNRPGGGVQRAGGAGGGPGGGRPSNREQFRQRTMGRQGLGSSRATGVREVKEEGAALNPVVLIQRLLEQGDLDEVESLLNGMEGDQVVIDSFRGVLAMKREEYASAVGYFRAVVAAKPERAPIWLYLGQALYHLEQYGESLEALHRGREAGAPLPAYFLLRARVEEHLDLLEQVVETLDEAGRLFPNEPSIVMEQALLFIKVGLYGAALQVGGRYLQMVPEERNGYLILGEAMRKAGRYQEAAIILEEAALRFNQDGEILARLAMCYSDQGNNLTAARLLDRAARNGGDYGFAAGENYRLAGKFREASLMNGLVDDPVDKYSQRLAIYLGENRFYLAAALEGRLEGAGAIDDTTRYRLAFAYLQIGAYDEAARLGEAIEDPALRSGVTRMLRAVAGVEGESR